MATVLIRNLSDETRQVRAARAERYPRSLEAELCAILDAAAQPEAEGLEGSALGAWLVRTTRPNADETAVVAAFAPASERPLLPTDP